MQPTIDLPENVLGLRCSMRMWTGVTVIHSEFTCSGRVLYEVPFDSESRLGLILEEVGEYKSEPRLAREAPCRVDYKPQQVNFVPAGMTVWGYSGDIRHARDVRLCFDAAKLREACQLEKVDAHADVPRLRFSDAHISTVMRMLADVVGDTDPSVQLYGDALIAALAARLFLRVERQTPRVAKLSPMQLRNAINFLEEKMPLRVDLQTLASLAGLSPSYYNRAFKAATGLAPYQWQLQARVQRAQALLLSSSISLDDVAEATGFADAVHFARMFRKLTGATPSAWRKDRLS
jgi:AraC-like DNA-binding protein